MFYNLVPFVRGTNFKRSTKRQVCYNCVKSNCPVLGQIIIETDQVFLAQMLMIFKLILGCQKKSRVKTCLKIDVNVAGQSSKSWPILAEITCTLARDNLPPNNFSYCHNLLAG